MQGVRVAINAKYKTTPPVHLFLEQAPPVPPSPPAEQSPELEFERLVIEEQHRVSAAGHRPTSTADYLGDAARFEQRGIKRDVALLGLAMFGKRDEKKIMDFSKNLTTLLGMGFKREDICGALADSDNDVGRAVDLLSAS